MRVHWYKSLQFKLFLLMLAMVAAAIGSVSWQNMSMFRKVLDRQNEESTVALTRRTSASLNAKVQFWTSLVSSFQHTSARMGKQESAQFAEGLVTSNTDIVALQTFEFTPAANEKNFIFTKDTKNPGWTGKKPAELEPKIRELGKEAAAANAKSASAKVDLANLWPTLNTGITQVRVPFTLTRDGKNIPALAVLSVWSGSFLSDMIRGENYAAALIRSNGTVIFDSKGGVQNTLLAPLENPDISTLFNGDVGFQTKQSVDADSVSVLTVWSRLGSFDWALRVQKSLKAEALYTAFQIRKIVLWSLILFLLVMAATYFAAVGISGRISAVTMATARVAAGHFDLRINPGSADEVGLLSVSVNRMAYEIQQLMEARTEAVRREMELKTAEMVQGTFLPEAHCEEYGLLSRGVFRPATECAGDLWGRFNLGKGKVLLMIADAVGHGASAALIAAMAYSYFATLQKSAAERAQAGSLTPNLILQDLHAVLWGAGKGLTTMTMVVALVDVNKGVLQIANAGHPFPMFIANGKAPAVVNVGGSILGLTDVSEFGERQIELQPGDKLFMYTDGMVECVNTQGDVMKPRKVKKMLADAASNTQNAFFDTVSQELDTFFENATLTDDVTALMMEVAPHWKAQTA